MTDTYEAPSGGEADEVSPDLGEAGAEAEQVDVDETPAEPTYDFLEVTDEIRGKHVPVKADGEEVPVTFDELVNSYSRESVSTKRFQEAAEMRKEAENAIRLQQALSANPGLTVQYLAQEAGVSVQEYLGMTPQEREQATADNENEYVDPLEQKLNALSERFEQQEADRRLMVGVDQLKSTYSLDDNQARAVVGQAFQMGLGPEMFPMVYQAMAFQASQQARAQQTAQQEAESQKRRAAAAQAAQVSASGTGATGTTTQEPGVQQFTSIREAAMAALDSEGIE